MKTIEIKTYSFEELSKEAQAKVIEAKNTINVDDNFWFEHIKDHFLSEDHEVAKYFEVTNMYFSGFWSNGDGAMFEYDGLTDTLLHEAIDSLKLPKYKKQAMKQIGIASGKGTHSGHYYHERSCYHALYFECDSIEYENIDKLFYDYHTELEEYVEEKYRDFARELYADLEKEYDYFTSEEVIKETIIANDYEFTADGSTNINL